jgi:CubicO group peptidase (beta-lactamase class C family)
MKICTRAQILRVGTLFILLLSAFAFGQTDIVKSEGISSPLHRANVGKIVFTNKPVTVPIESLSEADFLKTFELGETADLTMKAFLGNSLTNYLHRLAPELSADELTANGNYQVSFFVDGALVCQENLYPWWISAERKNTETIFGATLIDSADPESPWGAIWHILQINGGAQALTAGNHLIKIELRPYVKATELKVGELIASGELRLTVIKPKLDEKLIAIQPIEAGSGWQVSKDTYDQNTIRELNRAIAENLYKDIKSIVVIKNGDLLLEEYFNGADRNTLHNTRSVGKSFTSTMMGFAINDGYIKSENQTLKDFYDLRKFANYSPRKETVTLKSLLTMSSGFDGDDDDENSPGNEEKMYPTDNYVKFALDVPMDDKTEVGEKWRYFTAGVVVLGDVINKSVPGGLEKYADEKLFRPLGIRKYEWQHTPQRVPLTAGGLQMSALDFAKYGQLYKNGGRWNGKQILPQSWVDKTFTKYLNVSYGPEVFYGYLFWNTTFKIGDKSYETFFATGNGGNKIFIFKDQPLVIVVTATAFGRWYMHMQVDSIMTKYVLPAVTK